MPALKKGMQTYDPRVQKTSCDRRSRKSEKIFSATGPWVVLRFLLRRHVADIYARHEPELDALNTQC